MCMESEASDDISTVKTPVSTPSQSGILLPPTDGRFELDPINTQARPQRLKRPLEAGGGRGAFFHDTTRPAVLRTVSGPYPSPLKPEQDLWTPKTSSSLDYRMVQRKSMSSTRNSVRRSVDGTGSTASLERLLDRVETSRDSYRELIDATTSRSADPQSEISGRPDHKSRK